MAALVTALALAALAALVVALVTALMKGLTRVVHPLAESIPEALENHERELLVFAVRVHLYDAREL